MTKLLVHLLVSALLLWLVSQIVHGIRIVDFGNALLAALVLGLVNFLVAECCTEAAEGEDTRAA